MTKKLTKSQVQDKIFKLKFKYFDDTRLIDRAWDIKNSSKHIGLFSSKSIKEAKKTKYYKRLKKGDPYPIKMFIQMRKAFDKKEAKLERLLKHAK